MTRSKERKEKEREKKERGKEETGGAKERGYLRPQVERSRAR